MNIKQIFKKSLKITSQTQIQAVKDGWHIIHASAVSLGDFFGGSDWKTLEEDGSCRLYESAKDFFSFSDKRISAVTYEKYLSDINTSYDLQSNEIFFANYIFMLAALSLLAKNCVSKDSLKNPDSQITFFIDCLRFFNTYESDGLFEKLSSAERVFMKDQYYARLDRKTKDLYRYRLFCISQKNGKSERENAEALHKKASNSVGKRGHIGYYLFENKPCRIYIPFLIIFSVLTAAALSVLTKNVFLAPILIFPVWEIIKTILDSNLGKAVDAEYFPRMELKTTPKTLVTIVTFISSKKDIDKYVSLSKKYYYTNKSADKNMKFGFLADLPSYNEKFSPEDETLISYAKTQIQSLNRKFGDVFFCAVRGREYNHENAEFSAYERKRGAVENFLTYVHNGQNGEKFELIEGDVLNGKYFVSLDSDTTPDISSIKKLVGALEHPLSLPELNDEGTSVKDGYAIAVPRIDISLGSSNQNIFTKIISCFGGTEIYENVSFNLYQDLFGEAIFSGKGVINVKYFNKVLQNMFPENTVLSHDILEGSFLRTAFVSDSIFYDSVPKNAVSFAKRSHRWIRGDWQNCGFLMNKIKTKSGISIKNPLNAVSKFKLFDNLRRSLTFPAVFILILISALAKSPFLFFIAALTLFISPITLFFDRLNFRENNYIRYKSGKGVSGSYEFLLSFLNFLCLPFYAFTSVDAIFRVIYRKFISKKKLLEWTTADTADKKSKESFSATLLSMLPQFFGILVIFNIYFLPLVLLWLFTPVFVFLMSNNQTKKEEKILGYDIIKNHVKNMWGYFETFLNERNNFLPPDNFQEAPVQISAERTSPTNIGLSLLCILGAKDLDLIDEKRMYFLLQKQLETVNNLEKYDGHLYNWYDTVTKKPLRPMFISTVDNGNFAACLYALKNAADDFKGEEGEKIRFLSEKILSECDFSFLYNEKRDLFYIGFDAENGKFTDGHYDFYASEARLTSYFCIAMGIIPRKHWAALNRFYVKDHGFLGVKSWNGTMFEYFMPHLLLPISKNSLDDEMLHFSLHSQISAVPKSFPWGVSESAYYAFDRDLNYQYKAFGVKALALKKIPGNKRAESVVSPYSTFLTLPKFPKKSLSNLSCLEKYETLGQFGLYEALDFPRFEKNSSQQPSVVMNYMAHHLGMSIISCVGYFCGNIMQKRFMDERMTAFSILLEQKLPSSVAKFRLDDTNDEKKEYRERYQPKVEDLVPISPENPVVRAVCGGNLTEIITDSGNSFLSYKNIKLTRKRDMTVQPKGLFAFIKTENKVVPFTFSPLYDQKIQHKAWFEDGMCVFYSKFSHIETKQSVAVDPVYPCQIREYSVKNNSQKPIDCSFLLYFEPILCDSAAEESHPAFANLFIEAFFDEEKNTLLLRRRPRDEQSPSDEYWFAISCDEKFVFELSRFNVLNRSEGEASLPRAFEKDFSCETGGPVDPCVAIKTSLCVGASLRNENIQTISFYISAAKTRKSVLEAVAKGAEKGIKSISLRNSSETLKLYGSLLAKKEDIKVYELLLTKIFSKKSETQIHSQQGVETLWKYGVSGDFPVILVRTCEDSLTKCRAFVKAFIIMKKRNIDCELVFCFSEGGSYERKIWNTLKNYFRHFSCENLIDKRNGVFLANVGDVDDFNFLRLISAFFIDLSKNNEIKPKTVSKIKKPPQNAENLKINAEYTLPLGFGGFTKNGYAIENKQIFPNRPAWANILANPVFGTVLTENDLGFTFYQNSALNKITPWTGDSLYSPQSERLILTVMGRKNENCDYDLIKNSSVLFEKNAAFYASKVGNVEIFVKIFVPLRFAAKIYEVSVTNSGSNDVKLSLFVDISMNSSSKHKTVIPERKQNVIFYKNPFNSSFRDGYAFLSGEVTGEDKMSVHSFIPAGKKKTSHFVLGYATNERNARILSEKLSQKQINEEYAKIKSQKNPIEIKTESKELDCLYNTFLYSQIINSRIYGRTGNYQCGGAFGFRDQLQDCVCVSTVAPNLLKRQIIRASKRQFPEGDVLHWWHEQKTVKGTRTRFSDDLLWLPFALCEYFEKTGDSRLISLKTNYTEARKLADDEDEIYTEVKRSELCEPILEHCKRAIKKALTKGAHGLITFGSGDWNDGMNRFGSGETVFSTIFAIIVLEKFADLCDEIGDSFSEFCREQAKNYRAAVEESCFDGTRYLRGFTPENTPLGAESCDECKIDLLPQSFAAIAGNFDENRVITGLETASKHLVDKDGGLIKLFSPPFKSGKEKPGYIKGYINGVRENGGQYTHAAVWFALAHIRIGKIDEAFDLLCMINPVNHSKTLDDVKKYRVEPYVLSADVYSNPAHNGMGGWSFYTGAAGWYFKVVTEEILGIKRKNGRIFIKPNLPTAWNGYKAEIFIDKTNLLINAKRTGNLYIDGILAESIPLDGKSYNIEIK